MEYTPGREGMVPIEQLTTKEIRRPDDVVSVGDELSVKVFEIDQMGRVNFTALGVAQTLAGLEDNESAVPAPKRESSGGDRGGRGGGYRNDRGGGGGDRGGDRDRGPRRDSGGESSGGSRFRSRR